VNGAEALIRTLVDSGVDTCFMNPGTSEMHFVAALDAVPEMRGVLGLFEGVATGGADGYARMKDHPAAVLLHLGPGLGNGLANLHNARKGSVPIVNVVGDHATYHKQYDAQLESDIETVARNVSPGWVRRSASTAGLAADAAEAVAAALGPPGQVATLILPADISWSDGGSPAGPAAIAPPRSVDPGVVETVAKALRSDGPAALLLGGTGLRERGLRAANRIAAATGAQLLAETFPTRVERGAGLPEPTRLAYLAEFASMQLAPLRRLVLVGAKAPVSFFAYPGRDSYLVPEDCELIELATVEHDVGEVLEQLADALDAPDAPVPSGGPRPERPIGALTADAIAAALGALLPEGAIVSDEAQTSGLSNPGATVEAPPHSWLCLTGGAIGQGLPVATGAAVAAPGRRVVALEADGSALYTMQSLWTQAREGLDVTTIIYNNRSYSILNMELNRVGVDQPGPKALSMLDLHRPDIDFVSLSKGLGVPATRAETAEELTSQLEASLATPGPSLIEAMVPPIL
jgi:acetolactate synthase-1/2/3 large subunit